MGFTVYSLGLVVCVLLAGPLVVQSLQSLVLPLASWLGLLAPAGPESAVSGAPLGLLDRPPGWFGGLCAAGGAPGGPESAVSGAPSGVPPGLLAGPLEEAFCWHRGCSLWPYLWASAFENGVFYTVFLWCLAGEGWWMHVLCVLP